MVAGSSGSSVKVAGTLPSMTSVIGQALPAPVEHPLASTDCRSVAITPTPPGPVHVAAAAAGRNWAAL